MQPQGVNKGNALIFFFLRISRFHREDGIVYGSGVPVLGLAGRMNKPKLREQQENQNRKRQ